MFIFPRASYPTLFPFLILSAIHLFVLASKAILNIYGNMENERHLCATFLVLPVAHKHFITQAIFHTYIHTLITEAATQVPPSQSNNHSHSHNECFRWTQ